LTLWAAADSAFAPLARSRKRHYTFGHPIAPARQRPAGPL